MDTSSVTEQKTTHTAGPWQYVPDDNDRSGGAGRFIVEVPRKDQLGARGGTWGIATVWCQSGGAIDGDHDEANARLIAAAPDLLSACRELVVAVSAAMRVIADLDVAKLIGAEAGTREKRLVDELHVSGVRNGFGVRANAAVAKAEGRSA